MNCKETEKVRLLLLIQEEMNREKEAKIQELINLVNAAKENVNKVSYFSTKRNCFLVIFIKNTSLSLLSIYI